MVGVVHLLHINDNQPNKLYYFVPFYYNLYLHDFYLFLLFLTMALTVNIPPHNYHNSLVNLQNVSMFLYFLACLLLMYRYRFRVMEEATRAAWLKRFFFFVDFSIICQLCFPISLHFFLCRNLILNLKKNIFEIVGIFVLIIF